MKTKFLSFFRLKILVVFFMQVAVIQAQDNYQTQMDVIFDIPSYKITTGVLINRSPNINVIDCSRFISGVYFVNITLKDNMRTIKIIKK